LPAAAKVLAHGAALGHVVVTSFAIDLQLHLSQAAITVKTMLPIGGCCRRSAAMVQNAEVCPSAGQLVGKPDHVDGGQADYLPPVNVWAGR
jgi:uncharacterized protein (DUF779 family)